MERMLRPEECPKPNYPSLRQRRKRLAVNKPHTDPPSPPPPRAVWQGHTSILPTGPCGWDPDSSIHSDLNSLPAPLERESELTGYRRSTVKLYWLRLSLTSTHTFFHRSATGKRLPYTTKWKPQESKQTPPMRLLCVPDKPRANYLSTQQLHTKTGAHPILSERARGTS